MSFLGVTYRNMGEGHLQKQTRGKDSCITKASLITEAGNLAHTTQLTGSSTGWRECESLPFPVPQLVYTSSRQLG